MESGRNRSSVALRPASSDAGVVGVPAPPISVLHTFSPAAAASVWAAVSVASTMDASPDLFARLYARFQQFVSQQATARADERAAAATAATKSKTHKIASKPAAAAAASPPGHTQAPRFATRFRSALVLPCLTVLLCCCVWFAGWLLTAEFRSFPGWKNREDADDDSEPGPLGLSTKLWLKFRQYGFQLHRLLDEWGHTLDGQTSKDPSEAGDALECRPPEWEALHKLADTDWAAFLLKFKLFLRTIHLAHGQRWSGSEHLCSWQGDGRTFREAYSLLKLLPSFKPYFKHLTQKDVEANPDAVFHFFRANVPSRVLAIVFRTKQHEIPLLSAVAWFRQRSLRIGQTDDAGIRREGNVLLARARNHKEAAHQETRRIGALHTRSMQTASRAGGA